MAVLEVCCYSMACAREAERCGADRIELCAAPQEGGLTPSYGVLVSAREAITLPVHPIVRPRGGDFCYTEEEFAAMLNDIRMVRDLGFPGLVTGVLDADGQVDIPRMKKNNGRGGAAGGDLSSGVRFVRRPASGLENAGDAGGQTYPDFRSTILGGERYFINYGTYCRRGYSNHYGRCGSPRREPAAVSAGGGERGP